MTDCTVREVCVSPRYNKAIDRCCTDDEPCVRCIMAEDERRSRKAYRRMGEL